MDASLSDALVFFGATGDLAYKQIFPALQALVKRHNLDIPIVGVAKAGWNLDQLKARARDSIATHGGVDEAAFAKFSSLLQYVDGDYRDAGTYTQLHQALGQAFVCTVGKLARVLVGEAVAVGADHPGQAVDGGVGGRRGSGGFRCILLGGGGC